MAFLLNIAATHRGTPEMQRELLRTKEDIEQFSLVAVLLRNIKGGKHESLGRGFRASSLRHA
jgi:hypothetical protein